MTSPSRRLIDPPVRHGCPAERIDPQIASRARRGSSRRALLVALTLVLTSTSMTVGSQEPAAAPPAPSTSKPVPGAALDAGAIVRQLTARSAHWIVPSPKIQTLEYDLGFGSRSIPIKVAQGEQRRDSLWMGATLQAGFRALVQSPDTFHVKVERGTKAERLVLVTTPKDDQGLIRIEIGNGVENSWNGYFSRANREATIVVDANRLVPLEERLGSTTIRYSNWQETGAGHWVPLRVDVIDSNIHYRMHFAWLGDLVWLLRRSESIAPEGATVKTLTRNVKINGHEVETSPTDAERRAQQAAEELRTMLDHNRPWLDAGPKGVGWRPPFQTLSYKFHTVREDVRENCVLNREGVAAFEVSHDGLGKLKTMLGARWIALDSPEIAVSQRGARFARVSGRSEQEPRRGQPHDLILKQYARIGCQLDLPLFRYHDQLAFATVTIEDGIRAGQPCRVATVSNLHGPTLGCGTMLAFTSWSYVHDITPIKEVITIDPARNVPIHETLVSSWDNRTFEIDFGDYVEVEAGQWAPRSIRIEAKDGFRCEYRFQIVAGTHWMLKEVVSWFKPEEKSRGVVTHVRLDAGQEILDETRKQVETTRALFRGAGESNARVETATIPFSLGRTIRTGPYEIRVTLGEKRTVVVSATTDDPTAADTVPLAFFDEKQRLLFATTVALAAQQQGGPRQGAASLRGSQPWASVRSIGVPAGDANAVRQSLSVVPVRWGETFAVNLPDSKAGEIPDFGSKSPRKAKTRPWQARLDRTDAGAAKLSLSVVSLDGPREFSLDLPVALLGESGEILACGHLATSLKVVSEPVEQGFEIDLSKIRGGAEPKSMAIGIAPGEVLSAPMGSFWGMMAHPSVAFEIATLLAAPDESCWRAGFEELNRSSRLGRILPQEFLEDQYNGSRANDGPYSRHGQLRPLAQSLVKIIETAKVADLRAEAARLLAYSEAEGAAEILEPLTKAPEPQVRDAAVIGLTFLGQPQHLDLLQSILNRKAPAPTQDQGTSRTALQAYGRLEKDVLTALARQRSDTVVDLLGETLLSTLESLRPVPEAQGQTQLDGRPYRAQVLCRLLGRSENPGAVRWLIAAADQVGRRPELAKAFDRGDLVRAILQFKEQTRERIVAELETGDADGTWAYAVRASDDPDFHKAIRTMLQRKDLSTSATAAGVFYLGGLDIPEAVDGLRDAYDRGLLRSEPDHWLKLCGMLAAKGDGRGLADAYNVLVSLQRPAEPPAEERQRYRWHNARRTQQNEAEAVFGRASPELRVEFVLRKAEATSPEERRVVLLLLGKLPAIPQPFAAMLARWTKDEDRQVAEQASRLLDRD